MLISPLTKVDLDAVRNIYLNIIKAAVASCDQLTQEIKDIVVTHSSRWPIVKHEHVIVE